MGLPGGERNMGLESDVNGISRKVQKELDIQNGGEVTVMWMNGE